MLTRTPARYIAAVLILILSTSSARPAPGDARVPSRIVEVTKVQFAIKAPADLSVGGLE